MTRPPTGLPDPRHPVWYFPVTAPTGETAGYAWADHTRAETGWLHRRAHSTAVHDLAEEWAKKLYEAGERPGVQPLLLLAGLSREPGAGEVLGASGMDVVHRLAHRVEDSDDHRLLAELSPRGADEWRELREAYEALTDADRKVEWGGGERSESGAIQVPYPKYSAPLWRVVAALYELGAVTPEHRWTEWPWPELPAGGRLLPADAVRAATALLRAERMSEGGIDKAAQNGLFDAIVVSLLTCSPPVGGQHPA
ncbi:DUF6508 domain-containing protein [Streptomyces niveiscabiei]|uniref:DUF6508 domain-containing protein n=1 Tax=Streptomyces niveiscabiei TaxID=164115 RepID=UPI0029BC54D4|nr:DUF6508 domain-containing protein [Streptomyces niveiscabiei]MDX3385633.1 DUF6508 domain-containing protein [Streptomyces niveiscabiei]